MTISNTEYWREVEDTVTNIVDEALDQTDTLEEAEELINDSLLHETIDSHEWVIYYSYNLDVLQHSDNADYMTDNIGGESEILKEKGIDGLHTALAYWALYADVQDRITAELEQHQ